MIRYIIDFCAKNSIPVLVAVGVITVVFGIFALGIDIDSEVLRLLPADAEVTAKVTEYAGDGRDIDHLIIILSAEDPFTIDAKILLSGG